MKVSLISFAIITGLFLFQYATMRLVGRRRWRAGHLAQA